MPSLVHNPNELMKLSRDELDELLLEEYKNPALLRQLVRICLNRLKGQTELTKFYKQKQESNIEIINNIKDEINEVINKYKY